MAPVILTPVSLAPSERVKERHAKSDEKGRGADIHEFRKHRLTPAEDHSHQRHAETAEDEVRAASPAKMQHRPEPALGEPVDRVHSSGKRKAPPPRSDQRSTVTISSAPPWLVGTTATPSNAR